MTPFSRRLAPIAAAALLAAGAAQAQDSGWRPFASITPIYQGSADLDGGGDYRAVGAIVRAGVAGPIGGSHRGGLTFNYDYTDYSFAGPAAFGGVAPWGKVQRFGMAAPLFFNVSEGWIVNVAPSVDTIRENGASASDALNWGAVISATRWFADGNRIGLGVGVFERIEKTSVFPLLLVDWKISERWRLTNPLTAGPTGPAGLELDYRLDSGWNVGVGAAWRTTRFRLRESAPVPEGIGEERGLPVFLRASRSLGPGIALNLYAGVITNGQLRLEDRNGNRLREVDFGSAPLVAATLTIRR